jgi:signal peptidase II
MLLVAAAVLVADQATKALVLARLHASDVIELAAGVRLRLALNTGWVLGRATRGRLFVVWAVGTASAGVILSEGSLPAASRIGLGLAAAGATGNLLDRLCRGGVLDFIQVGRWPIFNMADVAIVAGLAGASAGLVA